MQSAVCHSDFGIWWAMAFLWSSKNMSSFYYFKRWPIQTVAKVSSPGLFFSLSKREHLVAMAGVWNPKPTSNVKAKKCQEKCSRPRCYQRGWKVLSGRAKQHQEVWSVVAFHQKTSEDSFYLGKISSRYKEYNMANPWCYVGVCWLLLLTEYHASSISWYFFLVTGSFYHSSVNTWWDEVRLALQTC